MIHSYGEIGFFGMHMFWWIFWIAIVIGGISLFEPVPRAQSRNRKSSPLDILQKRYANGELSDDEYDKRKSKLEQDSVSINFSKPNKV